MFAESVTGDTARTTFRHRARARLGDPLHRNAYALMLNTGLTGALGFLYWVLAARFYPAAAVGAAGALVSLVGGLSAVGQLNLSGMLMRFLPTAGSRRRQLVLGSYALGAGLSSLLAVACLALVMAGWVPAPVEVSAVGAVAFVLAVAVWSVFNLQDNTLIGLRRSLWVPVANTAYGIGKIGILVLLAGTGSSDAIFASWVLPLAVVVPLINLLLFQRYLARSMTPAGSEPIAGLRRFVVGEAGGGVFQECFTYLLPVLVVILVGAEANAAFYVAMLMVTTLDLVAANLASSLTVEGSHSPEKLGALTRATLRTVLLFDALAVATVFVLAPWLLRVYGNDYAVEATTVLRLLVLATLPRAVIAVYLAVSRVQHKTHRAVWAHGGICIGTFGLSVVLAEPFGTNGVAAAVLACTALVSLCVLPQLWRLLHPHEPLEDRLTANIAAHDNGSDMQANNTENPIRVLEVTARYLPDLGGVETHVHEVTRRIAARRGVEVTVLATGRERGLPGEETRPEGFNVIRRRAWPRGRDYYIAPGIVEVIRRGGWDVVHVQGVHSAVAILAMWAAKRSGIPYVVTFHTGGHSSSFRNAVRSLQWRCLGPLLAGAERLVAVGRFEQRLFQRCTGIDASRFAVIRNGGSLPPVPTGIRRVPGRIVSSGRLERYKGHHRVIEALALVRRRVPEAHLHILGAGPDEAHLINLAEQLGVAEAVSIRFLPPEDREAMARALAEASVFAALSDYEAHPLAVMEALAMGVPVVGYQIAGVGDLVEDGLVRGVEVGASPARTAEVLVQALTTDTFIDPTYRSQLPTWETAADRLTDIYLTAASSAAPRRRVRWGVHRLPAPRRGVRSPVVSDSEPPLPVSAEVR